MDYTMLDGKKFKEIFVNYVAIYFEYNIDYINKLNVFPVPDGDTGTNMNLTIKSAVDRIEKIDTNNIGELIKSISRGMLLGARGNSGVILSQIWRGISQEIDSKDCITTKDFSKALQNACSVAYGSVMKPVEGTILTVIKELAKTSVIISKNESNFIVFFQKLIEKGQISLQKTKEILPILKEVGVVDSGAQGLIIILEGILFGLKKEKPMFKNNNKKSYDNITKVFDKNNKEKEQFGFCTEFIIKISNDKLSEFKDNKNYYNDFLTANGNSLVLVNDEDILKVHIHTLEPLKIFDKFKNLGEIILLKAENMQEQVNNIEIREKKENKENKENEKYKTAIITVANGKGIIECFKDLGVAYVINGGQSFNPSSEDFLNAINNINSQEYIILPNNNNIFLSAEQVKLLTDKKIHILPTCSVQEGISCCVEYNMLDNAEENLYRMKENLKNIKSISVTKAIRNVKINDLCIEKNDYIGIYNKNIINNSKDIKFLINDIISKIIDNKSEIITLYFGKDADENITKDIVEKLKNNFEYLEIISIAGGQEIYDYLISIE